MHILLVLINYHVKGFSSNWSGTAFLNHPVYYFNSAKRLFTNWQSNPLLPCSSLWRNQLIFFLRGFMISVLWWSFSAWGLFAWILISLPSFLFLSPSYNPFTPLLLSPSFHKTTEKDVRMSWRLEWEQAAIGLLSFVPMFTSYINGTRQMSVCERHSILLKVSNWSHCTQ